MVSPIEAGGEHVIHESTHFRVRVEEEPLSVSVHHIAQVIENWEEILFKDRRRHL